MRKATLRTCGEVEPCGGSKRQLHPALPPGYRERHVANDQHKEHKKPVMTAVGAAPSAREGPRRVILVAERPVGALKLGNASGAKGPQFQRECTQENGSR